MSTPLKLVSLNVQRANHLHLVLPFLRSRMPDVVCVQELYEVDIPLFQAILGNASCVFAPMSRYVRDDPPQVFGVGIFSRYAVLDSGVEYYRGDPATMPELDELDPATWNNKNFPLVWCDVKKNDIVYRVATTHFTWSADGQADDDQRRDVQSLLKTLAPLGELVLTGDFNAPRGREIFSVISEKYTDNVPEQYQTSLDSERHRVAGLTLMVDGMFSTPEYAIRNVELISGISDHCAVVGVVGKDGGTIPYGATDG